MLIGGLLVQKSQSINIWKEKAVAASFCTHCQHLHSDHRKVCHPSKPDSGSKTLPISYGSEAHDHVLMYQQYTSTQEFTCFLNIHSRLPWLPRFQFCNFQGN